MRNTLTVLAATAALTIAAPAFATVLNFDDLDTSGGVVAVPNNYGGIKWNSAEFGVWNSVGYGPYAPASSPNVVLTNRFSQGYDPVSFSFAEAVTFSGMYLSYISYAGAVSYDLMLGGSVKATVKVDKGDNFYSSGYNGSVDQVRINGQRGYYVFDNVTFNNRDSAVPEPGTWMMMILGFGVIGYAMRRKTVLRYV